MSDDSLHEALKRTLEDRRLTRGERRALRELLRSRTATPKQRELLRHAAFELARAELVDPHSKDLLEWLEDIVRAVQAEPDRKTGRSEACFTPGDDCPRRIAAAARPQQVLGRRLRVHHHRRPRVGRHYRRPSARRARPRRLRQ